MYLVKLKKKWIDFKHFQCENFNHINYSILDNFEFCFFHQEFHSCFNFSDEKIWKMKLSQFSIWFWEDFEKLIFLQVKYFTIFFFSFCRHKKKFFIQKNLCRTWNALIFAYLEEFFLIDSSKTKLRRLHRKFEINLILNNGKAKSSCKIRSCFLLSVII